MDALTQGELNRLGACVVHDLQDFGEDDDLGLAYEVALRALRKVADAFGLSWREAIYDVEAISSSSWLENYTDP